MKFRIGIGFDLHRLEPGNQLTIGGISIPHERSLVGHSDGDVLIHAVTDALLGACGLGNIGEIFPDTDPRFKGISSVHFLKRTAELIRKKGYEIGNIDSTICLQDPKVNPHIPDMQACLAKVMGIPVNDISIKATTTEHLGFVGKKEGVAAFATVLIIKQ